MSKYGTNRYTVGRSHVNFFFFLILQIFKNLFPFVVQPDLKRLFISLGLNNILIDDFSFEFRHFFSCPLIKLNQFWWRILLFFVVGLVDDLLEE